jgi:hypothetical protein
MTINISPPPEEEEDAGDLRFVGSCKTLFLFFIKE